MRSDMSILEAALAAALTMGSAYLLLRMAFSLSRYLALHADNWTVFAWTKLVLLIAIASLLIGHPWGEDHSRSCDDVNRYSQLHPEDAPVRQLLADCRSDGARTREGYILGVFLALGIAAVNGVSSGRAARMVGLDA